MRIQLSSNFQVVELSGEEVTPEAIETAIELVNKLGREVVSGGEKKEENFEHASEEQIKYMKVLGLTIPDKLSKKRAWEMIKEAKDKKA